MGGHLNGAAVNITSAFLLESAGAPRQFWRVLPFKAKHGPFDGFYAFHEEQSSRMGSLSLAPLLWCVWSAGEVGK